MRALGPAAIIALSVVLLGAGCAPGTASSSEAGSLVPERPAPARVRVTNHNWSTMNVFVVRGTSRFRLGMVTSMSTETFRLPPSVVGGAGGVRLLADPIGGTGTFLTPVVNVYDGEEVAFDIQNHLAISSVSVWRQHR